MLGKKPVKKAAKKAAPKPKKPVEAVNKPKRVGVKNLQPNEPLALEPGLHAAEETTPGEAKRAARKVGRDQKKEAEKQAKEAAKAEAAAHKEAEKKVHSLFKGVKAKDLVFEGDVPVLALTDPHEPGRVLRTGMPWPAWIGAAVDMLKKALDKMGIDLSKLDVPTPEELLHQLIEMVEDSPKTWQRLFVLAALNWLHKRIHKDQILLLLKGE